MTQHDIDQTSHSVKGWIEKSSRCGEVIEGEILPFIKNILESLTWPPERGSVGIERWMMATQLCPAGGRNTALTITPSGWKGDYLCWLLFPKHWDKKKSVSFSFPFVQVQYSPFISDLLQHCAGWFHPTIQETSEIQSKWVSIEMKTQQLRESYLRCLFLDITLIAPGLRSYFNTDLPGIVWVKTLTFIKVAISGTWPSFLKCCQVFVWS